MYKYHDAKIAKAKGTAGTTTAVGVAQFPRCLSAGLASLLVLLPRCPCLRPRALLLPRSSSHSSGNSKKCPSRRGGSTSNHHSGGGGRIQHCRRRERRTLPLRNLSRRRLWRVDELVHAQVRKIPQACATAAEGKSQTAVRSEQTWPVVRVSWESPRGFCIDAADLRRKGTRRIMQMQSASAWCRWLVRGTISWFLGRILPRASPVKSLDRSTPDTAGGCLDARQDEEVHSLLAGFGTFAAQDHRRAQASEVRRHCSKALTFQARLSKTH